MVGESQVYISRYLVEMVAKRFRRMQWSAPTRHLGETLSWKIGAGARRLGLGPFGGTAALAPRHLDREERASEMEKMEKRKKRWKGEKVKR